MRWQLQLAEYNMELHHVAGTHNVLADGLSRMETRRGERGEVSEVMVVEVEESVERNEWRDDEWYGLIVGYKRTGQLPEAHIKMMMGDATAPTLAEWRKQLAQQAAIFALVEPIEGGQPSVLYKERYGEFAMCVRKGDVLTTPEWAHDLHGNFAESLTLKGLIGRYYWPRRHRDVAYFRRSRPSCQKVDPFDHHKISSKSYNCSHWIWSEWASSARSRLLLNNKVQIYSDSRGLLHKILVHQGGEISIKR